MLALGFDAPAWLWTLLATPSLWILLTRADTKREKRLADEVGSRYEALAGRFDLRRSRIVRLLTCAALVLAVVALADPRHGAASDDDDIPSLDIVVCLDVSRSMRARDLEPDRLGFAHAIVDRLSRLAAGDRLGLVAFAGEARLLVPLTDDLRSFALLGRGSDELSVDRGGTNLAAALSRALAAIDSANASASGDSVPRPAAILLLSDGEDLAGQGLAIAETCRKRGVPVHVLGLGSPLGSKIPILDDGGERFVVDASGREVVSILDTSGLQSLARASGGSFVSVAQDPDAIERVYSTELRTLARQSPRAVSPHDGRQTWFVLPLVMAFLSALGAMAYGHARRD